jgi:hypothetical protein
LVSLPAKESNLDIFPEGELLPKAPCTEHHHISLGDFLYTPAYKEIWERREGKGRYNTYREGFGFCILLLPTEHVCTYLKGIVSRDEYFFKSYVNKLVLSVLALIAFSIFCFLVDEKNRI